MCASAAILCAVESGAGSSYAGSRCDDRCTVQSESGQKSDGLVYAYGLAGLPSWQDKDIDAGDCIKRTKQADAILCIIQIQRCVQAQDVVCCKNREHVLRRSRSLRRQCDARHYL